MTSSGVSQLGRQSMQGVGEGVRKIISSCIRGDVGTSVFAVNIWNITQDSFTAVASFFSFITL